MHTLFQFVSLFLVSLCGYLSRNAQTLFPEYTHRFCFEFKLFFLLKKDEF